MIRKSVPSSTSKIHKRSMSATEVTHVDIVNVPDKELVAQFVESSSERALEELIRRYQGLVWSSAYRVLYDRDTAIDCTQETFVIFARNAIKIRDGSQVSSWLFTTSNRIAKRMLDKSCRQKQAERQMLESIKLRPDERPPEILAVRETWQALAEELCQLPEKYRTVLLLHFVDNQTHRQVSDAVGIPLGSVSSSISIGLKKLKERLDRRSIALASVLLGVAMKEFALDVPQAMASGPEITRAALQIANANGAHVESNIDEVTSGLADSLTKANRLSLPGVSGTRIAYLLIALTVLTAIWFGQAMLSNSARTGSQGQSATSQGQSATSLASQAATETPLTDEQAERLGSVSRIETRLQDFGCEDPSKPSRK